LLFRDLQRLNCQSRAVFAFTDGFLMSEIYAGHSGASLRIRVVRPLDPREFESFDVSRFQVGGLYEVGLKLGELLIVGGYAHPDRRAREQAEAADHPRRRKTDRR
jgi:hypothetical protein